MNVSNITLLSIIFFFLLNLITITFMRRLLTYKGIKILLIVMNIILTGVCLYSWTYFITKYGVESTSIKLNSNNWTNINYELSFKVNSLSFLFIMLVSIIGLATNVYILNYFKYEERAEEFILLINWFILSMIFLVIGNNFFTIIIGWELIGLTSFLLINFWKFKVTTLSCSFKAFTFNKISDIFLMISFCLMWNLYKINNIDTLLMSLSLNTSNNTSVLIYSGLCLIISSSIKSAQIFGHLWLPDSMEAPVPASSLIHSATLVSAGIYLILKFQTIFIITNLMPVIFFIGSVTACFGGLVAASQSDMKKLLAYSTISHCGFIFASIALNNFVVTIVYLYLHGLYKALTFFCAGSLIKSNGTQDMRLMGMAKNQIVNTICLIIASINLGGLPYTFGYLYKFLFLNMLIVSPVNFIAYGFNIVGLLCGVVYVFKIIFYSCFDYRKGFLDTITLLIQNSLLKLKNFTYKFTVTKVIAFSIIYIFSIFFFIIVKFYILKHYIFFIYLPETQINDYMYLSNVLKIQSHLTKIYYILFLITVVVLLLLNWRENYFFIEKLELLTTVFAIIVFFYISNGFIFYLQSYLVLLNIIIYVKIYFYSFYFI